MKGNINYDRDRIKPPMSGINRSRQPSISSIMKNEINNISNFVTKNEHCSRTTSSPLVKDDLQSVHIPSKNDSVMTVVTKLSSSDCKKNSSTIVTKKNQRPSLSEQLAKIGEQAELLTLDIRKKGKLDENLITTCSRSESYDVQKCDNDLLFTMPAKLFSIGSLSCRYPSPVYFYLDRCEYLFNHPYESSSINMIIYYKDMISVSILSNKLKFKLPKKLGLFLSDFDPSNPNHAITIESASSININDIKVKIIPIINSFKQ